MFSCREGGGLRGEVGAYIYLCLLSESPQLPSLRLLKLPHSLKPDSRALLFREEFADA